MGVIGSLVYLAAQIREKTRSHRATAYQAITGHVGDINRALFENAEVAHIVDLAPKIAPSYLVYAGTGLVQMLVDSVQGRTAA